MERATSFTIPANGDVRLSSNVLAKYGLKAGDEVAIIEVDAGVLIASKAELVEDLLDQIGSSLNAKGITLDVLMERSARIRAQLLEEMYGINDET